MKETCRETLERAVMLLDGEDIDSAERRSIEQHLHECAPCYERLGVEREVKNVIHRLRGSDPCPDHLRSKIEALIESGPTDT